MNRLRPGLTFLSAVLLLSACGGGQPASGAITVSSPAAAKPSPGSAAPASPGADADWNNVVAAAKKEGEVVVWAVASDPRKKLLKDAFEKANPGITVNLFQAPSTGDRDTRFQSEFKAGVAKVDVIAGGAGNVNGALKPQGMVQPAKPFLRPELLDPKTWVGGKLTWGDEEEQYLLMADSITDPHVVLNSSVDTSEVQSWEDLLKDKFKGKIVMGDPRTAGTGWAAAVFLYFVPGLGEDYMKKLFDHRVVLSNDDRTNIEWTDSGKMLANIYSQPIQVQQIQSVGSKVKVVHVLKIGNELKGSFFSNEIGLAFPKLDPLPHPNATKVYANWLYSKEGQQAMVDTLFIGSRRTDVDNSKLPSYSVPEPNLDNVFTNPYTAAEPTKKMRDFFSTVYAAP
jgi:iron(III) transport system substrate-binding protein